MWQASWLSIAPFRIPFGGGRLFRAASGQVRRRRCRTGWAVESLEDRTMLSAGTCGGPLLMLDAGPPAAAEIHGFAWHDENGDGVWDADEPALEGWTIYLDVNNNGRFDAGEPSILTAADGSYAFTGLAAGTYNVAAVLPDGWQRTFPEAEPLTTAGSPMTEQVDYAVLSAELTAALTSTAGGDVLFDLSDSSIEPFDSLSTTADAAALVRLDAFRSDPRFAGIDGSGFAVVVLDTGMHLNHPFFGPDGDGSGAADRIVFQYDFYHNDNDAADFNGHGTQVTSIIASGDAVHTGVAPGVDIIHLKVFSDQGGLTTDAVLEQALQWVVANAAAYNVVAVNLSLGAGNHQTPRTSHPLRDEFAALAEMHVLAVAASGNGYFVNGSQPGVAFPSADPDVISVGAVYSGDFGRIDHLNGAIDYTTDADRVASFSQRHGTLTDTFAPGPFTAAATLDGGVVAMGGTSAAAAHVTGAAILAQQVAMQRLGRRLTAGEFRALLQTTGVIIIDGDGEDDNVINTGLTFPRLDIFALAEAIWAMGEDIHIPGTHLISLEAGQIVENVNFGNRLPAPEQPELSINDVMLWEGDDGLTPFQFTVTLSHASDSEVIVVVNTADGTATADEDYLPLVNELVTFAPGQTSRTVTVSVIGDTRVEEDETFFVVLSEPRGAAIAEGQGTGTGVILDDDLFVWTGLGDGTSWHDAANWVRNALPGEGAVVSIPDVPGTTVIVISTGVSLTGLVSEEALRIVWGGSLTIADDATVAALSLEHGALLDGLGDVTVSGVLTWTGGFMQGTGRTIAAGGLIMDGPHDKNLRQRTLENRADATWSGTGLFRTGAGAVFLNAAGATFDVQTSSNILFFFTAGGETQFHNAGTLRKSGGTLAPTEVNVSFHNTGVVEIQTGTLQLRRGGTSSGSFQVAAGATLDFAGGTHTLQAGSGITGLGTVRFGSGTANVAGHYAVATTAVSGAVANFNTDATTAALNLTAGTLGGAGRVTVDGPLTWTAGTMSGSGRTIAAGGLTISGSLAKNLRGGRTLENRNAAIWTGSGNIQSGEGAVFVNTIGAVFDVQNNALIADVWGGDRLLFENAGTLRKSVATGTTTINALLDNSGTIDVQTGTLDLTGGLLNFAGQTLTGGTYVLTGTLRFVGADIRTNAAAIMLNGSNARIANQSNNVDALANFSTNAAGGSLALQNRSLTTPGVFGNAGRLTIDVDSTFNAGGNYTQTDSGVLEIEIGGPTPGSGFGRLTVGGTAALGGTLGVSLSGGFTPQLDHSFRILTFAERTGQFATYKGLRFDDDLVFEPQFDATGLSLVAVEAIPPRLVVVIDSLSDLTDLNLPHNQAPLMLVLPERDAEGAPLSYEAVLVTFDPLAQQVWQLSRQWGLWFTGSDHQNWAGVGEKWLQSASGAWFFITPAGNLHRWSGVRPGAHFLSTSPLIAALDETYYADPSRLYDAPEPQEVVDAVSGTAAVDGSRLVITPAAGFLGTVSVRLTASGGPVPVSELFQVHVTNALPVLNIGEQTMSSNEVLEVVLPEADADGDPLSYAAALVTFDRLEALAWELSQELGLRFAGSYYQNWGGMDEKWLHSASGAWYFITPAGNLHQWGGGRRGAKFLSSSPLIAELDASYFADPSRLFDAAEPQDSLDESSGTVEVDGHRLRIIPAAGFAGTLHVRVTATDGWSEVGTRFAVQVVRENLDALFAALAGGDDGFLFEPSPAGIQ